MPNELRYVFRSLLRRKAFALVTILTLALGIGSATAIYSVVAWYLFRGPPAPPDVYMLGTKSKDGGETPFLPVVFARAYAADKDVIADAAFATGKPENVVVDKEPITAEVTLVADNFFQELSVTPEMGRTFLPAECIEGRDNVVVVSHGFWKAHLGSMPGIIGARVRVGGDICTVVGVLRSGQRLPSQVESPVFRPYVSGYKPGQPFEVWPMVLVRLKPGVTPRQAEAALAALKLDLPATDRDYLNSLSPRVSAIADVETYFRPPIYWTLVGAVGFLYAIACLNATNLSLVRLFGRRREFSVRTALGGTRLEILRLVGLETVLLTLAGTMLGAVVANGMAPLFQILAGNGDSNHRLLAWNLDGHAFGVLASLSLATALLTCIVPISFLLRANVNDGLKGGSGSVGESPGLARTRGVFVILQAAFAVVLLMGAGLMIRTFQRMEHLRLGFDPTNRVKIQLAMPSDPNFDIGKDVARLEALKGALLGVPGVASVAYSSGSLLSGYDAVTITVPAPDGTQMKTSMVYSSADYVAAGGIRLLAGRWFADSAKMEVVVNETFARKLFGEANPIDQFVRTREADAVLNGWRIVGVTADVREKVHGEPMPTVYAPVRWSASNVSDFLVGVKLQPDARMFLHLRQATYAYDPNVVIWSITPLDRVLDQQTHDERLTLSVLRVLSSVALALTLVGLYSIIAYTVDKRMGEFGIRMAVGATPAKLMALVFRRSIALTAIGVALGTAGAMALTRFLSSLLFEAPPFDAVLVLSVAGLLVVSGSAACLYPAFKASKPDLTTLLRQAE